jgi:hypothetical protein
MPYVRTFCAFLTGSGRLNATVASNTARTAPNNRHSNLKQVEEALNTMIATGGKPVAVTDVQAELFLKSCTPARVDGCTDPALRPRVSFAASPVSTNSAGTAPEPLEQAKVDLNFQSPETVCTWYTRWSDEFDAAELATPF